MKLLNYVICVITAITVFVLGIESESICDQPDCKCTVTTRGTDVNCSCSHRNQKMALQSEDLPENAFNLIIENCGSLGVTNGLSSLRLRTITFKGIQELRIPSQSFLSGLRQLSSFVIKNTTIPRIPSFSFSSLSQVFDIHFMDVDIGAISSDAFSDVSQLQNLKFINSKIKRFERHSFGRGTSKIANLILDGANIETIQERAIWLSDVEIVHIDKCNIKKVAINAIILDNAFFIYLTRSSVQNYEAGGIKGRFFSGVMIDNNYLNPSRADTEPRSMFDLEDSRQRGSSVAPFFHFTNNVMTKLLPDHAFFVANPTINVAVPNNTLGDCSCPEYKQFLQSLRPILDDYTLNIHQALVEHGICLVDRQIFSIGCPDLTPTFEGPSKKVQVPSRGLVQQIRGKSRDDNRRTTTTKPNSSAEAKLVSTVSSATGIRQPTDAPKQSTTIKSIASERPSPTTKTTAPKIVTKKKDNNTEESNTKLSVTEKTTVFNEGKSTITIGQPVIAPTIPGGDSKENQTSNNNSPLPAKISTKGSFQVKPPQFNGKTAAQTDADSIWNEIFGGIFALRLRKPLPDAFPTAKPSVKFGKIVKPLELRKFQMGNTIVVSPR